MKQRNKFEGNGVTVSVTISDVLAESLDTLSTMQKITKAKLHNELLVIGLVHYCMDKGLPDVYNESHRAKLQKNLKDAQEALAALEANS